MTRNRRTTETHTLQCWPGGQSFEYRGDVDGPANQRSLRAGYYQARVRCPLGACHRVSDEESATHFPDEPRKASGRYFETVGRGAIRECHKCHGEGYIDNPVKNPWRKGTADEWRKIRIEVRAEIYGNRDILGCDSSLVDDLIKAANSGELSGDLAEGFGYDEIRNIYADPDDWDADKCQEYAEDHGVALPPVPRLGDSPQIDDIALEDEWLPEAREACRDHAQENPAEVYEWWRVSSWLCDQLHAIGEVTIDNNFGTWWGRTCTGQGWIQDGTLQQVAAQFEQDEDDDKAKIARVADVVAGKGDQA